MKKFEYRITKHSAEQFNELVFFCSESGECSLNKIPRDQVAILEEILNAEGDQGWELIQLIFGEGGILAFWKRDL